MSTKFAQIEDLLLGYQLNNIPLALRRMVLIKCLEYPNFDLIHAHEFPIELPKP